MGGFNAAYDLLHLTLSSFLGASAVAVGAWFLACIFLLSGSLKLRNPMLVAMAIVDFGIPITAKRFIGYSLAFGEMSLGTLLAIFALHGGTGLVIALSVATGALWIFTLLVSRSLLVGAEFSCHCFGDTEGTIGRSTLLRTLTLALASTVALATSYSVGTSTAIESSLLEAMIAVSAVGTVILLRHARVISGWDRDSVIPTRNGRMVATWTD